MHCGCVATPDFHLGSDGIVPAPEAAHTEESRVAASAEHADVSKVAAMSIMLRRVKIVEAHNVCKTSHTCLIGSKALWRCTDAALIRGQRCTWQWGMPWVY